MTRRRSRSSTSWPAVILAVAVGAGAAVTARRLLRRDDRHEIAPVLAARRMAPPGAHRPGDG